MDFKPYVANEEVSVIGNLSGAEYRPLLMEA